MTVIAWDGRTLAADKRGSNYGLRFQCTKLFRAGDDALLGVHGSLCEGVALVDWYRAGADPKTHPKPADKEDTTYLLVIHRDGRIGRVESNGQEVFVEEKFWAEGVGRDFALAAMHLGLDARSAVEFAARFLTGCGDGCDTLTFDEPAKAFAPPL